MATAADLGEGRAFSISTVLSRAFGVIGDNPLATLGIAFLLGGLPQAIYTFLSFGFRADSAGNVAAYFALLFASYVITLLCAALVQASLVRATAAYISGERASIAACLTTGLRKLLPVIGLSILMVLGLALGFVLLVVPGVILFVVWSVAFPALVADDVGVIEAFGRSAELTKGARWRIFGVLLIVVVMMWILGGVSGVFLVVSGGLNPASLTSGQLPIAFLIVTVVTNTLSTVIMASTQTSLYLALREWKEGPQTDALAAVFA